MTRRLLYVGLGFTLGVWGGAALHPQKPCPVCPELTVEVSRGPCWWIHIPNLGDEPKLARAALRSPGEEEKP